MIAILFEIAKDWKQPKCSSIGNRLSEPWYFHIMEYYAARKGIKEYVIQGSPENRTNRIYRYRYIDVDIDIHKRRFIVGIGSCDYRGQEIP